MQLCNYSVKRIWSHGLALIIIFGISGSVFFHANSRESVEGWAVLLETNDFPEGYEDLPVNFVDVERVQHMLVSHGWQKSHIWVRKDRITPQTIQEGFVFLENADEDDIVVFYICSHGGYIQHELRWNQTFPTLWEEVTSRKRVLVVDSCAAESFLPYSESSYIGIASVSYGESAWVGTPEEGLPVVGFVFTYYFCQSMEQKISVEEGFKATIPLVRDYMGEVVFPEFKEVYPPQSYNMYSPHPVIRDQYPGELYLHVEQNASFPILLVLWGMLLILLKKQLTRR